MPLPVSGDYSEALWAALLELTTKRAHDWSLIGGQMILLHALERDVEPVRVSTDLDVIVNTRVVSGAVGRFVRTIESLGFDLVGASPDGIAHRYKRGDVTLDVLAPDGVGPNTDLTTTPPGRTIQVPGGTQALARTELLPVDFAGRHGLVPRPSLLGAIICKVAAVSVGRAVGTHQRDLAFLLSLAEDPAILATQLTPADRSRLRTVAGIADSNHDVWNYLAQPAAHRARAALISLLREPATPQSADLPPAVRSR